MTAALRILLGAVCVWLAASVVVSPVAMWSMGDAPITLHTTAIVAGVALVLGAAVCLFIGAVWLLAAVAAWAWDQ